MIKTLVVVLFVAIVILTECLFAYFVIPSRNELEKWSAEKVAKEAAAGHNAQEHKREGKPEAEVDLGTWLQNPVCLHSGKGREGQRRNRVVRTRGMLVLE